MAPDVSTVFLAEQMSSLLKQIDDNVRLIVHCTRKQGAQVQQEVVVLLQNYLGLLSTVLGGCKHMKTFAEISQRSLVDIEKILTLVLKGSVREILEDIRMERYLPNFEKKDLRCAYQLLKDNFDIGQVDLHTDAAKEAIHDKIQDLRNDFHMIEGRLNEVKEKGDECCRSCKKIAQDFDTFMKEIKKTQEKMASLLACRSREKAMSVSVCLAVGVAITLFVASAAALVVFSCGCACVIAGALIPLEVVGGCCLGGGVIAGGVGFAMNRQQKKEIKKIDQALEKLQQQLNEMRLDVSKQKTAWKEIDIQAKSIWEHIVDPTVKENVDNLEPSHRAPVARLLQDVQSVRTEVEDLEDKVEKFQKGAKRTLDNLLDLSLIKESDTVPAPAEEPTAPLKMIQDFTAYLEKAKKTGSGHVVTVCMSKSNMAASLIVE